MIEAEVDVIDINSEPDRSRPSFGNWTDEADAAAEFDRRIAACGLFVMNKQNKETGMYREVRGYYLTHRPNRERAEDGSFKEARIDRVLMPTQRLIDAGWTRDIGVEIKRSGTKIGRPIQQAIDYTHCAWNVGTHWMVFENIFLWPFEKQSRALESVMLANGVGVIYEGPRTSLIFQLEKQVIRIGNDGSFCVQSPNCGTKVGSR